MLGFLRGLTSSDSASTAWDAETGLRGLTSGDSADTGWDAKTMDPYVLGWLTGLPVVTGDSQQGQVTLEETVVLKWEYTPEEREFLKKLQGVLPKPPREGTPLRALLHMLNCREVQHYNAGCAAQCQVPEESKHDWWVRAGSHNLVTSFADGYVLRAGYRLLTQKKLADSRAWAALLADEGIGVRYLLYDTPVLADVEAYIEELCDVRWRIRRAQDIPCSTISPVEPGLLRTPKQDDEDGSRWRDSIRRKGQDEYFCLVRQIMQKGTDVDCYLTEPRRSRAELRQALEAVYTVLEKYTALLQRMETGVWFGIDLKFINMIYLNKKVFLADMEPGDAHNIDLRVLRSFRPQKDRCHTLQDRKEIWPPANEKLWPLALYLYALSNSTQSIGGRVKGKEQSEATADPQAMDWEQAEQKPACPVAAALAVLRDKAGKISRDWPSALVQAIELLAAASWESRDFETFEDQLSHYLDSDSDGKLKLQPELAKRKKCVVGRLSVLFGYALSCHTCGHIQEKTRAHLDERLKKLAKIKAQKRALQSAPQKQQRTSKKPRIAT